MLTERKLSQLLRAVESTLPHSCRYKEYDIFMRDKRVQWVTQASTAEESQLAAQVIASALTDWDLNGWAVQVVCRNFTSNPAAWQLAISN